jgi:DNA-binding MarR family transcriptional regulator/N-acetylglutamate synthase-like GNAT family acetyltransferase
VRVLYEIAHRPGVLAGELARDLGLDRGYLSRLLTGLESQRLLARIPASGDARRRPLRLTPAGSRAFAPLERRARAQVRTLLKDLSAAQRQRLLGAMQTIRDSFDRREEDAGAVTLRSHRPGDMGWVVERHGALYYSEFGFNEEFEGVVAGITADFIRNFDAARERCWIAEKNGERIGCVFLVKTEEPQTAKLRMLLVEREARGLGLGARLIDTCIRFAREKGYERIVLWTHANLQAARELYRRAGFTLSEHEPRHSFGQQVVSENWQLILKETRVPASRRLSRAPKR